MSFATDPDPIEFERRILDALAGLSQIGAAVTRIAPGDWDAAASALQQGLIRVIQAIPGASAAVYTADPWRHAFDLSSRVSAGNWIESQGGAPRFEALGLRAIDQRRLVLSDQEPDLGIEGASMACFPLVAAGQSLGILCLDLGRKRPLARLERLALENVAHLAAMAVYQARRLDSVQRDLARKEDELDRLRRAGMLISSRLGLEETLEAILQMALEVTGARYGIFRLVDAERRNLVTRAIAGERLDRPLVEALPIDEHSVMGWVALHRQPVCIVDLQAEPWVRIYHPLDAELQMRSELTVPLIDVSGRLEGVINLESPRIGAFSESDSHLLQSLATQAVIAIQQVRLLDALQEVAHLLLARPGRQVLSRLVDLACDLLNASASAIWILQGEQLILEAASAGYQRGEHLPLQGSLTGEAILRNTSVTADNVRTDPRFHRPDLAHAQSWSRALIVPLSADGDSEPIGAFSVYSAGSEPGRFAESEWDEKVLTFLAHYAALAVHSDARQKALREAQERHAVAETFAVVGDIASNLLHQLNNKVGTIPVRVQGIQDKCRPALLADAYLDANLQEIERSATEAMAAVRENLSHLHPIHLAPVDVAACAVRAIQSADLPPGVRVEVQGLSSLPAVAAGNRSLSLVFENLLNNAAEAMKGQGVISIFGAVRGDRVGVSVRDSGPGIAPELHGRIFEFNFSGRSARTGKLGFGLWWVKSLMARLGGSVSVESDGRHGTTFRLSLPSAESEP